MREFERKQLLERANKESAIIGANIPDTIDVQGETIDLREFVFEIKRRETIPAGEQERVDRAKKNLRRERIERMEKIENNEVSFEEGETLVQSVIGIDRALNALEQLRPVDIEQEAELKEAADQKRWMDFLRKVLDRDDSGPRVR